MKCTNPECGAENLEDSNFCKICGHKIQTNFVSQEKCEYCGHYNVPGYKFCNECGKASRAPEDKCSECGFENAPGAKFCSKCRHDLTIGRMSAEELNELGKICYFGLGVEHDYANAVKWFRKAAEQGLAEAQRMLGIMYRDGLGVEQSDAESVKWFGKAEAQEKALPWLVLSLCTLMVAAWNQAMRRL